MVYLHTWIYTNLDALSKYIQGRLRNLWSHIYKSPDFSANGNVELGILDLVSMFRKFLAYLTDSTQVGMACRASFSPINCDAVIVITIALYAVEWAGVSVAPNGLHNNPDWEVGICSF